jgi:hypothetical protein
MENHGVQQYALAEPPSPDERAPITPFKLQAAMKSAGLWVPIITFTAMWVAVQMRELYGGDSKDRACASFFFVCFAQLSRLGMRAMGQFPQATERLACFVQQCAFAVIAMHQERATAARAVRGRLEGCACAAPKL